MNTGAPEVPSTWITRPLPRVLGVLVAALALALAVRAFLAGAVSAELAWLALGAAGFALGAWWGTGRGAIAWGALAVVLVAALWALVHPALAVLAALAALGGTILAVRSLRKRQNAGRYLLKLAGHLAKDTKDDRPPDAIVKRLPTPLRPKAETRRGSSFGLPVRWSVPPHVPVDETARLLAATAVGEALRTPVTMKVRRTALDLYAAPTKDEETPDETAALAQRLNDAVRSAMGPELTVQSVTHTDDEVSAFTLAWPSSYALKASNPSVRNRVLKAAGALLGGSWNSEGWDTESGTASFHRIGELPKMIPHPGREVLTDPSRVEFATLRNGGTAYMNLDHGDPHCLILGVTEGGKTALVRAMLYSMPQGTSAVLLDVKQASLLGMDQLEVVESISTDPADMAQAMWDFRQVMHDRYKAMKDRVVTRKQLTPRVLVIDEAEGMFDVLDGWWRTEEKDRLKAEHAEREKKRVKQAKDGVEPGETAVEDLPPIPPATSGTRHPAIEWLKNIVQMGREAKMYVIAGTQQADASWLGTAARNQFSLRIALGNIDAIPSRQLFGTPGATTGLSKDKGRAWIAMGSGNLWPEQAQVWWVPKLEANPSAEDRELLDRLGLTVPEATTERQLDDATRARLGISRSQHAPTASDTGEPEPPKNPPTREGGEDASTTGDRHEGTTETPEQARGTGQLDADRSPRDESDEEQAQASGPATADHTSSDTNSQVNAQERTDTPSGADEAQIGSAADDRAGDRDGSDRERVTPLDLEEGDKVWLDLGEGDTECVEVLSVEVDMHDPDLIEVGYGNDEGGGVLSLPEDELIERAPA